MNRLKRAIDVLAVLVMLGLIALLIWTSFPTKAWGFEGEPVDWKLETLRLWVVNVQLQTRVKQLTELIQGRDGQLAAIHKREIVEASAVADNELKDYQKELKEQAKNEDKKPNSDPDPGAPNL